MADPYFSQKINPMQESLELNEDLELGAAQLRKNLADIEVQGQSALNKVAKYGAGLNTTTAPQLGASRRLSSGIYYSPSLSRFSVGGQEFGRDDYDVALKSFNSSYITCPVYISI